MSLIPLATLTEREKQVLTLYGKGETTKAIARQLGISSKTAESHRERIKQKLGTRNTYQFLRAAILSTLEPRDWCI